MDSFNIILYSSVTPKAAFQKKKMYNLYYPDFFLFKMYLLFGHNEWKTQIKKGSPFSFHRKKAAKRQVQLQVISLREGTGASFKTNTFLAG